MTQVRFTTNTLLDPRAITVMGLNVKPNTKSPIGYFGTGLKYAIAVCCRLNIPITIWIGTTEYSFEAIQRDFRGSDYQAVRMRKRALFKKWAYTDLPFTTQYGRNWKLWQVLRELESNTRDEGGRSGIAHEPTYTPTPHDTTIIVDSNEFATEYQNLDKVFLPKGLTVYDSLGPNIEIFQAPSRHLYFRGMRVADLSKKSLLTYNILDRLDLTEDRTVQYMWDAEWRITGALMHLKDRAKINHVLNAKEENWESTLPFDNVDTIPSDEFLSILNARHRRASSHVGGWAPLIPLTPRLATLQSKHATTSTFSPISGRLEVWLQEYQDKMEQISIDLIEEAITALKESGK